MKVKFLGRILIILTLILFGCSGDNIPTAISLDLKEGKTIESIQLNGIRNYIVSTKTATRSKNANIRPYIDEDGDTL